jgi:tetratricopeptide (TPR) repeat protein
MLLKALEEEDVPVVFATSGFTYQGAYAELCQRFKRKGKTIFLGRLSDEMLVSAYKAAKVHALPSFYELPGMVSIEAAHYDCNVMTSPWGTVKDYLDDYPYYAEPDDPYSIRKAVLNALNDPVKPGLKEHVKRFTWERTADNLLKIYDKVLEEHDEMNRVITAAERSRSVGHFDDAIDGFKRALEIHPGNRNVMNSLKDGLSLRNSDEAEKYSRALKKMENERLTKCEVNIPRKLEDGFVFEEYNEIDRAFEMLETGSFHEADAILQEQILKDPNNPKVLLGLGKLCFQREKYREAKDYLEKAAEIQPTGEGIINLAAALEKLNLCDQALSALDRIRGLPGVNGNFDFDINRLRGHCMLRKGNHEEAEACYNKALLIDENSEKPHLGLGSLEIMKRNFDKAEEHFIVALEKNPRSDKARLGLSLVRMEQGRSREALDEARRALEINIENQQAMLVCVQAGLKSDRLDVTEKLLSRYIELHPANTEVLYTLAGVKFRLGDRLGAKEAVERILLFKPDHQAANELLGQLQ